MSDGRTDSYPDEPRARDRWIMARRQGLPRDPLDSRNPAGWVVESEVGPTGVLEPGLTIFLTNRECPWRCLMCDLWRHALEESVAPGDIVHQIRIALEGAAALLPSLRWIKLYNAGSFFDAGAIPPGDHLEIASLVHRFGRVIVENHPALTTPRILPFRDRLAPAVLEVALGLETIQPGVMDRLNKRVDPDGFRRAAKVLREADISLRVFILVKPPFASESEALEWGCRSVDFAFDVGASVVSLIPTRLGNGALEALSQQGHFSPPRGETFDGVFRYGLSLGRGRVFADVWELERSLADPEWARQHRARLEAINASQEWVA